MSGYIIIGCCRLRDIYGGNIVLLYQKTVTSYMSYTTDSRHVKVTIRDSREYLPSEYKEFGDLDQALRYVFESKNSKQLIIKKGPFHSGGTNPPDYIITIRKETQPDTSDVEIQHKAKYESERRQEIEEEQHSK